VVTCSFEKEYWNFELQKDIQFKCDNESKSESDKCIFHDGNLLDNEENHKIIQEEFQKKIDGYLLNGSDRPLFCIGYHLYNINIQGKEFQKSVYFDYATITGSLNINSHFISHVSFSPLNSLEGMWTLATLNSLEGM